MQHFRYITSSFINLHLCTQAEVCRAFNVSEDSVSRAYKTFKEKGEGGFFGPDTRHGRAHKLVGEKLTRIQSKLDAGQSVNSIATEEGVRESSIRAAINRGALKKREPAEPDPQQAQKESEMTGISNRI
jgi:transposase